MLPPRAEKNELAGKSGHVQASAVRSVRQRSCTTRAACPERTGRSCRNPDPRLAQESRSKHLCLPIPTGIHNGEGALTNFLEVTMTYDHSVTVDATNRLRFIAEAQKNGRPRPEDLSELREIERKLVNQIRVLGDDVRESILSCGIFVKPGERITGFTKDNEIESISIWRKE